MKLFTELQRAVEALNHYPGQWALCGGVAASVYRQRARFTDDIDFAVADSALISAVDLASKIISNLGYREYKGFITTKDGEQQFALVCARGTDDERFVGLDFLLPKHFWIADAVVSAQSNLIDYGFAVLPTITPESLILAKLSALSSDPQRYQDLDDIKEILRSTTVNLEYVKLKVAAHKNDFPGDVQPLMHLIES